MKHSTHITLFSENHAMKYLVALALLAVLAGTLAFGFLQRAHAEPTAADKQAEAEQVLSNLTAMQQTLDNLSDEYGEALSAQEEAEKAPQRAQAPAPVYTRTARVA